MVSTRKEIYIYINSFKCQLDEESRTLSVHTIFTLFYLSECYFFFRRNCWRGFATDLLKYTNKPIFLAHLPRYKHTQSLVHSVKCTIDAQIFIYSQWMYI